MADLYLMRHGQTLFNARHRIQGWCDSPLTPLGREQARRAARLLEGIEFDHAYCSTAERCCDTLEIVRPSMPYERMRGLKERGFGLFEGEPEDLNPKWEDAYARVCPPVDGTRPDPSTWDGYEVVFPHFGGETRMQVVDRMRVTCLKIMARPGHERVLAVSSAGACRSFMMNWLTTTECEDILFEGRVPNCAVMRFSYIPPVAGDDGREGRFEFAEILRPDMSGLPTD